MATPTANSVPTTQIDGSTSPLGQYLITGTKWGGAMGTGVTLTWSLPSGANPPHAPGTEYSDANEWTGFRAVTSGEAAEVRKALAIISNSANVTFVEVAESSTQIGEIRYGYSSVLGDDAAAYAYDPGDYVAAGDVWLNPTGFNTDGKSSFAKGTYDPLVLMHETMHALGIKHPFADNPIIPAGKDNFFYTIMSYTATSTVAQGDNYATYYPTTPMFYDLVALEAIYGRNTRVNAGDTVYSFNDGSYYWQAINDAGGVDSIVYNGSENSSINLNPGTFSALSEAISFSDQSSSRATVTIGPSAVIERAFGGSGADTIIGNAVSNELRGGAGADAMFGNGGNDFLDGGAGVDRMTGGAGNDTYRVGTSGDVVVEAAGGGTDQVLASLNYMLSNNVEVLVLEGSSAINGAGNAATNVLTGNTAGNQLAGLGGNDRLNGMGGNDRLTGGAGNDVFVFTTGPGAGNVDTITDFSVVDDIIHLENAVFTALGQAGKLVADLFWASTAGVAHDANDRIVYDVDSGGLFYDANGNGAGGGVQFAQLSANLSLSSADFMVI